MKSFLASPATIERKWYVIDAEGKTLGRLAAEVASFCAANTSLPIHPIWIPATM
jgi:ribosomal protein L13